MRGAASSCSSVSRMRSPTGSRVLAVIRGQRDQPGRAEQRSHGSERSGAGGGHSRGALERRARSRGRGLRRDARHRDAARGSDRGPGARSRAHGSPGGSAARDRVGQDQHRPPGERGRRRRADQGGPGAQTRGDSAASPSRAAQPARRVGRAAADDPDEPHALASRRAATDRGCQLVRVQRDERARRDRGGACRSGSDPGDRPAGASRESVREERGGAACAGARSARDVARRAQPVARRRRLHGQYRTGAVRASRGACGTVGRRGRGSAVRARRGPRRRRASRGRRGSRPAACGLPVHGAGRAVRGHGTGAVRDAADLPDDPRPVRRDPAVPPVPSAAVGAVPGGGRARDGSTRRPTRSRRCSPSSTRSPSCGDRGASSPRR